jgi:hypothetical protein
MTSTELQPLIRELFSRHPEYRQHAAGELQQWLLYALNYTAELEAEGGDRRRPTRGHGRTSIRIGGPRDPFTARPSLFGSELTVLTAHDEKTSTWTAPAPHLIEQATTL